MRARRTDCDNRCSKFFESFTCVSVGMGGLELHADASLIVFQRAKG